MNGAFERLWGRITRVTAFLAGLWIMVYETVADNHERPWLYAAAIGMMGLPIARSAENVLSRLSGSGPQEIPREFESEPEEAVSTQAREEKLR